MNGSKEDLAGLFNWLVQTGAIDRDFEALLWTSNCPLDILFEQLRDGVILVKIALFIEENIDGEIVTKPSEYFLVTDGATFRREKNISFFLRKCSIIGAKRSFTTEDLERDVNRIGVLRTLRSFSKRIEKKSKKKGQVINRFTIIPEIEISDEKAIDTEITYYMKKMSDQKYSNYFGTNKNYVKTEEFYERYLTHMNEDARSEQMIDAFLDKQSIVHNKILQLRQNESGYQRKFLKTLEKIISTTHREMEMANLWDIFRDLEEILTPLKKLHKKLFDKLLKNVNPGPVFTEMKKGFWIYAPFIVLLTNASTLIETFEKDTIFKQELAMIKSDMQKQIEAGDSSFPGSFDQLFYLPRQHLANYGIHLNAIIKSAKKELSKKNYSKGLRKGDSSSTDLVKIIQRCMKAKSAMDDVLNYVNYSVGENANKRIIRDLGYQLSPIMISPEDLASDFGALVFEGKILHKWEKDTKYVSRYMVCMQKLILISDIINRRGNKTIYRPIRELELHIFDPRIRYNVMATESAVTANKEPDLTLTVVITDNSRNPIGHPFNLKCRTVSSHQTLKKTLENLFSSAKISSKFHPRQTHDYAIHESLGDFKEPEICGLDKCGNILPGLFVVGVFCKSCKKYYHNHCFINNSPDIPYEEDIDLIRNLSRLDSDDDSEDEDVDEKCLKNIYSDFDSFKKNIQAYRIGSCILYSRDETNGIYKLAYKESGADNLPRILKLIVSRDPLTKKFKGANVLMENKEFDTFTDVVRYLKSSCSLKFIHKSNSALSKETSKEKTLGPHSNRADYPEEVRRLLCLGDRKLALKGTPTGTYLICREFKDPSTPLAIAVSRGNTASPGLIPFSVLYSDDGTRIKYIVNAFTNQREFDSISELILHYKTKCNLLYPIIQEEERDDSEEDAVLIDSKNYYYIGSSEEESSSTCSSNDSDESESETPSLLDSRVMSDIKATEFFGGFLDKFEAQKILLTIGVDGLYMLRVNPSTKDLRISLVRIMDKREISSTFKKLRVVNIKIALEVEEEDEGLKRYIYQMGSIRAASIKELIEIYESRPNKKYNFKYPYSP